MTYRHRKLERESAREREREREREIHPHTHARAHTHTHTHTHKPHACTNTHTHIHTHTHTHKCADTNTIQTVGAKDNTQMKYLEKRNVLSLFLKEGRKRIRVSDILGLVVPDMRTKMEETAKAMSFAVEASEF